LLDASGLAMTHGSNAQWQPAVAFNGSDYLVVWADYRNALVNNGNADIYGRA